MADNVFHGCTQYFIVQPATPVDRIERLTNADPDQVDLESLAALLVTDHPRTTQDELLPTVHRLVVERDEAATTLVDALTPLVERTRADRLVLRSLRQVANDRPELVTPLIPALIEYIQTAAGAERRSALACSVELAAEDPTAFVPAVPALAVTVSDESGPAATSAAYVLARVAHSHPAAVRPATRELLRGLPERPARFQASALSALGAVEGTVPGIGREAAPAVAPLITESSSAGVQANAAALLATIAETDPAAVVPELSHLERGLAADATLVARNAAAAFVPLGERATSAVPALLEVADHPDPDVRENVLLALGETDAPIAAPALRRAADRDPAEAVRAAAAWALESLRH